MKRQMTRRRFIHQAGSLGAIAAGAVGWPGLRPNESGSTLALANPDTERVRPLGSGWHVLPTGSDDHANLEWALRNTPRAGVVQLDPGVYKFSRPVIVPDFDGVLAGAGAQHTTLTCTDELSYEIWETPGGGRDQGAPEPPPFPRTSVDGSITRSAPGLLGFYKTPLRPGEAPADRANRIEIRDLRCRGAMVGEPWMFGDEVLCINIINSLDWHDPDAAPATTRQDVVISGVEVDGYSTPAFGPFENACACISVLGGVVLTSNYDLDGDVDGDAIGFVNGGLLAVTPADGDVTISSCTFRNCRVGPGVVGYANGSILMENIITDGCRGNCLQVFDVGDADVLMRRNDLLCDSFLLPPELTGVPDLPSSLGCTVVMQGLAAALGIPTNVQWSRLASDPDAHERHPEAGPLGTWRPRGHAAVPQPSQLRIMDNECRSSVTPNTYCVHVIDAAQLAFGIATVEAHVQRNRCEGSETCISFEHVVDGRAVRNECASQAFGIELHDAPLVDLAANHFAFPPGVDGCEVRLLELGEKLDFSRVVEGAGLCVAHPGSTAPAPD